MFFLVVMTSWAADCDLRALGRAVEQFDQAFVSLDLELFQDATRDANRNLLCLKEPLTPVHAADMHRIRALDAFVQDDLPNAIVHFQALQATQPGYALPLELVPEEHPMQAVFSEARQFSSDGVLELPAPAEGWLTVDGQRATAAPLARPWVFQHLSAEGAVNQTKYVEVGAALPLYPRLEDQPKRSRTARVLTHVGLGLAVAGVGVYGGAFASRQDYNSAVKAGEIGRIETAYGRTNTLALTAFGLGGLGLGVGVAGFVF